MITHFSETYSYYDADGSPAQVDIHITFRNRTKEEGDLVEKIRLLHIVQKLAALKRQS